MNDGTHQNDIFDVSFEAIVSSTFQPRSVHRCRAPLATIAGLVVAMTGLGSSVHPWLPAVLSPSMSQAAEPTSAAPTTPPRSAAWWRDAAARYVEQITDAESRGRARHQLTYIQVQTGDIENARATAAKIENTQLRVYSHCHIAKDRVESCRRVAAMAR